MLELHVWGPAFGLPSIDAHCLAAIAYLQQAVPRGKWQLIASSDVALSPTNELPALRNGDLWIGGFRNIFHYVAQCSAGEWVLDAGLPEQEGADCIAFSSFVESHGQPLLDLSLFVSSQNYSTITRPIYNTIQPFPLPYLTPPSLRAAAKQRTEHLHLSSLDIDTEDGEQRTPERSIIPESLRRPKATVSSLLAASPETNAQIRLDALASDFFEPLTKIRGKKHYFVSDTQFSSLDCLALGYLSLMLVPDLPQPWLKKSLESKFPKLASWTSELRKEVFSSSVSLNDAHLTKLGDSAEDIRLKRLRAKSHLPWAIPGNQDGASVGRTFLAKLADDIPVVGQLRRNTRMRQHGGRTMEDGLQNGSWQRYGLISSLVTGIGLAGAYMYNADVLDRGFAFSEKDDREASGGLSAFGDAGSILGAYANQMDADVQRQRMMENNDLTHGQPVAEIDVEVERGDGVRGVQVIS